MTQQEALAIMHSGASVLLTGAAGTGKTYTLNTFIKQARSLGKTVSITATTGLAATHLSGNTIHSWAGIGIKNALDKEHFIKVPESRKKIINGTDILIIDEVSMLHDYRLDMVENVCREIRGIDKMFGGIQVILCGDFYQIPPINRSDEPEGSFVVSSNTWSEGDFEVCYLSEQFRQKDDEYYTDILNGIRAGFLSRSQLNKLLQKQQAVLDKNLAVTRLLTTNIDTDTINHQHLSKLDSESVEYEMTLTGPHKFQEQLLKSCLAPKLLNLKVGAQVMCIKNSPDKRYVNGSLGEVIGFDDETDYPKVKLNSGNIVTIKPDTWELTDGEKVKATATQIPLRLAWAITVHKSQGMTLDAARIDLSRAFVEGMGYVALSRVKGLDSLALDGINSKALQVSPLAKKIDVELRYKSEASKQKHHKIIKDWQKKPITIAPKPTKGSAKSSWSDKLAKMRQEYPKAYMPWDDKDDKTLVELFSKGKSIKQLSKKMGRHEGSIKVRLAKHFGEDVFSD